MKNEMTKKIRIYSLCIILLVQICLYQPLLAVTEDPAVATDQKDGALEDRYDELEDLEKKEQKYRDILNLKQKEKEIITAQISKIESENKKIESSIENNSQEIQNLSSEIERMKSEVAQKEQHIVLQKKILEKFLRDRYRDFNKNSSHFTFLNIGNTEQSTRKERLTKASEKIGEYVKRIHTEQSSLKEDQTNLEKKAKRIEDAKYELEQRSDHLESSKNYKHVLAAEVAIEEDKYQEKLSKVVEEQLAIQQEISELSTGKIGEFSLADLPNKKEANFDLPVSDPYVVTQGYGKTSFSSHYKGGLHNGIDYVAKEDLGILAVADGKIKSTGDMGKYGYGKWVAIDHGNGLTTLYGHFSSVKVSKGAKIKKGATLGKMGSTGFSTGTHLHFSVFASTTFEIVESSSVKNVYIPTGATVNPNIYL